MARWVKNGKGVPIKGAHISPTTEFKKGHRPFKLSQESLKKRAKNISLALKGHKVSEATREKLRLAKILNYFHY